jgi:hypothetical protein
MRRNDFADDGNANKLHLAMLCRDARDLRQRDCAAAGLQTLRSDSGRMDLLESQ